MIPFSCVYFIIIIDFYLFHARFWLIVQAEVTFLCEIKSERTCIINLTRNHQYYTIERHCMDYRSSNARTWYMLSASDLLEGGAE